MRISRLPFIFTPTLAALLLSCGKEDSAKKGAASQPPVPVQTRLAEQKDLPIDVRAIGNVESIASIAIKAQVGGELISVGFEEGQDVKRGHLLFTIQPRLYETQLAQARANLARDRAQAANARGELARQEMLDRKGAGTKELLDRAVAQAEAADATVTADEALVLISETQLNYTTIESPIDGRTGAIRMRPGNLIKMADEEPLTTVVQLAPIYVAFSVPEQELAAIQRAMAARNVAVTARDSRKGETLGEGNLTFIANKVDAATGTVLLKATFENKDHTLWPGAFAEVALHLDVERGATVVPASAISIGQNSALLYVVKPDNTAELRTVKVGRTVGQDTAVLEGVAVGEKVVANGQSRLLPGSKVVEKDTGASPGSEPRIARELAKKGGGS